MKILKKFDKKVEIDKTIIENISQAIQEIELVVDKNLFNLQMKAEEIFHKIFYRSGKNLVFRITRK